MKVFTILISFIALFLIVNKLIKYSYWYKGQFGDSLKFKYIPTDLHVVNLGSNSGKYSFDYTNCEIKGMNWAVGPQTITFDYKILKKYIHYIQKDGIVLLPLSLFSSIKDAYSGSRAHDKYYKILSSDSIPRYSNLVQFKVELQNLFPIWSFFVKPKQIVNLYRSKKPAFILETNPMNETQLIKDAMNWIQNWEKEFALCNLETPRPEKYTQIQSENRKVLINSIELCRANDLKPIIVLPPVTSFLLFHLTSNVRQMYIYDFLNEVIEQTGVKLIDYMDNAEFSDPDLYFNSFFLNARGRKMFTKKVLNEINLQKNYD